MANAHPRRYDAEVLEGSLSPLDESVAFAVAGELDLHVPLRGTHRAGHIHHHGVIDDHIDRGDRVDVVRVAAELDHRIAHRRQIGDELNTGGVRHHQPRRTEGYLPVHGFRARPGHGADVVLRDRLAILVSQQVLEQYLQRPREFRDRTDPRPLRRVETEVTVTAPVRLQGPDHVATVTARSRHFHLFSRCRRTVHAHEP